MTDRPRYPRTGCCVPFCRRTSTLFEREWVCGEHWRRVDRALKRFRTKRLRALYQAWEKAQAQRVAFQAKLLAGDRVDHNEVWGLFGVEEKHRERWYRSERLIWRRMKAQAIERAAGA